MANDKTTTTNNKMMLLIVATVISSLASTSDAFLSSSTRAKATTTILPTQTPPIASTSSLRSSSSSSKNGNDAATITVISPPGGMGEMTAIESARLGGKVRWFVVSPPPPLLSSSSSEVISAASTPVVSLASETLDAIVKSGGSIEFAGATSKDLLIDADGALGAVGSWCVGSSSIICTYDGARGGMDDDSSAYRNMRAGIRIAAREATRAAGGGSRAIAILAAGEETDGEGDEDDGASGIVGGGLETMFAGLVGRGGNDGGSIPMAVPRTMKEVMTVSGAAATVIRYGDLFGAPESSPESSPFMGGPRRDPVVRDMYSMRSVRIDPAIVATSTSVGGEGGMGYRSNRLAVAEVASRLGLGSITSVIDAPTSSTVEVSLSSFSGTDGPTDEEWDAEFRRVMSEMTRSGKQRSSPSLFRADYSSVPSPPRLAEWLATKWAPAVLRSYDIAGIRVGGRPVYASVLPRGDDGSDVAVVEIVWQELVNFAPVTSGRMFIEVENTGISAKRGPGDASAGFGVAASTPLPGEDILVRRLADAASQAVEKGLAIKSTSTKKAEAAAVTSSKKTVTTVVAGPSVVVASPVVVPSLTYDGVSSSLESSGPRNAGARRSSERNRGSRRPASTSSPTEPGGE